MNNAGVGEESLTQAHPRHDRQLSAQSEEHALTDLDWEVGGGWWSTRKRNEGLERSDGCALGMVVRPLLSDIVQMRVTPDK